MPDRPSPTPSGTPRQRRRRTGTAEVTIRQVAQHADVSIATVSRVLNGHEPIAPATRERVLQAMAELRFRPSWLGRSLAERRHAANGIVFPDLSGPYYAEVVLGYEEAAGELGRSVLILSTHGRDAAPEMVLELAGRVDGLVLLGRTVSDEVVAEINALGIPLVLLARPATGPVDSIKADNVNSASRLGAHLIGDGCRRAVFVGDPGSSPDVRERLDGFSAGFLGGDPRASVDVVEAGLSEAAGADAGRQVLRDGLPDALVCANDELALGALGVLRAAGVDVPGDLAVTGWDDIMSARHTGLTTVRQPMRELGARAARVLDARIRTGPGGAPRHEVLPTELVVRTTCGPHPRRPR